MDHGLPHLRGAALSAPTLFGPPEYPDWFERLWAAYRKPVHKHAAFLEARRLRKAGQLPNEDILLAAIAAQHESERWRAGVQPDFRTWLHQMRWIDDPAQMKWSSKPNGNGKSRDEAPAYLPRTVRERWSAMDRWERALALENHAYDRINNRHLYDD